MPKTEITAVRHLVYWAIGLILTALLVLGGLGYLRYQYDQDERAARRASVCAAQRELAAATLEAFVVVFTPEDPSPEEAAEIEEAQVTYNEIVAPALARCGDR